MQYAQSPTQQKKQARKYGVAKIMDYLQWLLFALEMLFLLRFVLKLIGADPTNQFAVTLYNFTGFFLAPFEGIVPSTTLGHHGNGVIEWSTLVGTAVYALLFYLVRYFLRITISRPRESLE
jgi:YGGT family